jgi:CRP/FNR family cyclic AMP-dependent transcriptional regulator
VEGLLTPAEEQMLLRAPLFTGLPIEVSAGLVPSFVLERYAVGDVVFSEGEGGSDLYVILAGRVVLVNSDGHQESVLALLDAASMFGELSLFDPGPRTTTARALSREVLLACAGRQPVIEWAAAHPEVSARLLQVLARRLRRTNSHLRDLVFVDVPGRVAGVLCDLADRYRSPRGLAGDVVVEHGLTQAQLAQLVGASRETVNKALSEFGARGWIKILGQGRLTLRDPEALRRRASRGPVAEEG